MELVSLLKKQVVKVTIELTSELVPTSPDCLRYYNILFRRCVPKISFPWDLIVLVSVALNIDICS